MWAVLSIFYTSRALRAQSLLSWKCPRMSCLETHLHPELQCAPGLTDHSDLTGNATLSICIFVLWNFQSNTWEENGRPCVTVWLEIISTEKSSEWARSGYFSPIYLIPSSRNQPKKVLWLCSVCKWGKWSSKK